MKTIFAVLSLSFGFAIFIPYFINMWKKTATPHIFTWITWTILAPIGFFASVSNGGGGGALIFALQGTLCFLVVLYSIKNGEKNITKLDWLSFISSLIICIFYIFTKQAALSAVLAASIDGLSYIPTFRKSFSKPFSEPVLTFVLAIITDCFTIAAVGNYNLATVFYPAVLLVINSILVCFLLVRRNKVQTV